MSNIDIEEEKKRQQLRKDLEKYKKMERDEEIKNSLEVIGNSLLSGLASVTNLSAHALESAVTKAKESNKKTMSSEADQIKDRLALRKKQEVLKQYKKVEKKQKRKKNKMKSNAFLMGFLVSMGLLSVVLSSPTWMNLVFSFLIGSSASFVTGKVYNPRKEVPGIDVKEIEHSERFIDLMKKANIHLDKIYGCVENSKDPEIREQSSKLYERGIQIVEYIQGHPDKLMKGSRFLTYYLETASNICSRYSEYCENSNNYKNDDEVTESAKRAMILLENAFDKEFDKLMEDDIIDLETDVKVLENSMKWDNYMD